MVEVLDRVVERAGKGIGCDLKGIALIVAYIELVAVALGGYTTDVDEMDIVAGGSINTARYCRTTGYKGAIKA